MALKRQKLKAALVEAFEPRVLMSAYARADLGAATMATGSDQLNTPVEDAGGNLYGVDMLGGSSALGSIYEIAAGSGAVTTLSTFDGVNNGKEPAANLLVDKNGNLWGETSLGGTSSDGTIFEIVPSNGTILTALNFNGTDGKAPAGGLLLGSDGYIYGSTILGGANNAGSIFKFNPQTHVVTTVYSWASGYNQIGTLARDASGNLYGANYQNGTNSDGTVFKLTAGGAFSTLVTFNSTNGAEPTGLVIDPSGNLFGTTNQGGSDASGTLYEIPAGSSSLTTLFSFNVTNGRDPTGNLAVDASGDIFGSTRTGGSNMSGVVYEIPAGTTTPVPIDIFGGYGPTLEYPSTSPLVDSHGNIFVTMVAASTGLQNQVIKLYPSTATQIVATQQPADYVAGSSTTVSVAVEDAQGNLIVNDTAGLSMSIASGPGGAVLNAAAVAPQGGMAQLTINPTVAGAYTLAIANGEVNPLITASFTVSASTETALKFAQMPSAAVIDAPLVPLSVEAVDVFGNLVPNDNTSVVVLSLASDPNYASLAGTLTAVCEQGIATFDNVSINNVGSYQLAAVGGAGLQLALSSMFSVEPPTSTGTAGNRLPAIQAEIAPIAGHPKAKQVATISIETGPAGAKLLGATSVRVGNATAVFRNLMLTHAGSYTLKISDAAGVVTTLNEVVTPAIAARLIFVSEPPASTATGSDFSTSVEAVDRFGNVETSDASTLTLELMPVKNKSASLTGTTTQPLINGAAVFSNLAINLHGTYRLAVKATGIKQLVSKAFKII